MTNDDKIEEIKNEIQRIKLTFPPDSARVLIKDLNTQLNSLLAEDCPF